MKKKYLIAVVPVVIIILLSFLLFLKCYEKTEEVVNYLAGEKENALLYEVNDQFEINDKLDKISNNKKYTFDNAYVELNPYKISPLSAIIIFTTSDNEEVNVDINGKNFTKMEASKKHVIPIYGLYEDKDNLVTLSIDDKKVNYTIKTEKSNLKYPLTVEKCTKKVNEEELYFTTASLSTYFTGWDIDGNLRFYLTEDNRMDVEWLDNGHFLIGTTQDQTREQFVGFVEMDYLGKIYNYYTLQNGYSFEFQSLKDGSLMLAGGNEAIYFEHQMIHTLDRTTGKKLSELDLYEVIKSIDPTFSDKYLGPDAIRNGFFYNEETDELLVSFRDISTIFSFKYKEKKLNWVFTDPNNELFKAPVWKDYLIKLKSGRYPLGQHTPSITKEGYVALFNNGYDRYSVYVKNKSDVVTNFNNEYSSVEIYEIKDKKAKLKWSYDANKKLFSIKYGSFNVLSNNNKLIDFGYILDDNYRSNPKNTLRASEQTVDGNYTMILELDENDKTIFKATSNEGKFRVFKHKLYNETTSNINPKELNVFNNIKDDKIEESDYKKINLKDTQEWIYDLIFTKNTFTTNYEIKETDDLKLYFVNKTGKVYILNYKDKDTTKVKRVFNANLANGEYGLYINLNGIVYQTNKVYKF